MNTRRWTLSQRLPITEMSNIFFTAWMLNILPLTEKLKLPKISRDLAVFECTSFGQLICCLRCQTVNSTLYWSMVCLWKIQRLLVTLRLPNRCLPALKADTFFSLNLFLIKLSTGPWLSILGIGVGGPVPWRITKIIMSTTRNRSPNTSDHCILVLKSPRKTQCNQALKENNTSLT